MAMAVEKKKDKKKKVVLQRNAYIKGTPRPVGWCGMVNTQDYKQLVGSGYAREGANSDALSDDDEEYTTEGDDDDDEDDRLNDLTAVAADGEAPIIHAARPSTRNRFVQEHIANAKGK